MSEVIWPCECRDIGCPCEGACEENSVITLHRIDMEDATGTMFCDRCADDAYLSGVFTDEPRESGNV
jgi:hypothetical protein